MTTRENRVWIRTTNICNSNCVFCLDKSAKLNKDMTFEMVKNMIKSSYKPERFNKLILSGGEASFGKNFIDYISYGKQIGYQKIQTITNGIKFADLSYLDKAINAGLQEITFSLHGHTSALHDMLTGVKGSYSSIIKTIYYIKKQYPFVILNVDIVVNKINLNYVPLIIKLITKLGVFEFDILQVIPFGNAWDKKQELLFDDLLSYKQSFKKIWDLTQDSRVVMWANRVTPGLLDGYEYMIQSPDKLNDELLKESYNFYLKSFIAGEKFGCYDELRCKNCYNQSFCTRVQDYYGAEPSDDKNVFTPYVDNDIDQMYSLYGDSEKKFIAKLKKQAQKYQIVNNIPFCIINKNNVFLNYGKKTKDFKEYVDWYIKKGYLCKSDSCVLCKFYEKCKGIHINFIRAYGFSILKPIT